MQKWITLALLGAWFGFSFPQVTSAQEVSSLLARIKAVGKEGAGNPDASRAWKDLVRKGPAVLPDVLAGMDDASPIATNWLRNAVEAIEDRAEPRAIPVARLEAFLREKNHAGPSRRAAYECLVRLDPGAPQRLLPGMLDDPSIELRRDAVEAQLKYATTAAFTVTHTKKKFYLDLLNHARDRDQVNQICKELKAEGQDIDLTKHYGFLTHWLLAGPFDNAGGVGFNNTYAPEKGVDPKASYLGKGDKTVTWLPYTTTKPLGLVDINETTGKLHGAVVYAYTLVSSETDRPVELRAGSNNAVRIWLNGKELYFREEYHHGMEMDQHVGKGTLKAGPNEILIKVCQNEQTDAWAQQWSFQLRVCDAFGAAVPVRSELPR